MESFARFLFPKLKTKRAKLVELFSLNNSWTWVRPHHLHKQLRKRIIANNQIRAKEVRLIDENSKQLGIVGLSEALKKANEAGLDLIQVTDNIEPPVCKIMDYGKYAYQMGKKEKRKKTAELKSIRLTFKISEHDMEVRAKQAEKFLKQGHKTKIEMRLRGREKYLRGFAGEKMRKFLEILKEKVSFKIERDIKKEPRSMTMIISKS